MRIFCFFWVTVVFAVSASFAAERMDGTKWKAKVTPDKESAAKGARGFDDEFVFADGKFTSTALAAEGFKTGPYRFEAEVGETEWSADKESETAGKAGWSGRVNDQTSSGNFHWLKKDGTSQFYKFTATRE